MINNIVVYVIFNFIMVMVRSCIKYQVTVLIALQLAVLFRT